MAEATGLRNNALPYPIYGQPFGVSFPILDADGDLVTAASSLDSEVSKNGDTFADCTNEATELATSSGIYYLLLTATEMTADVVSVIVKTGTSGAKTTVLTLYPRKLVTIRSGTAAGGAAGYMTLDSGASAVDDFYNGCVVAGVLDSTNEVRVITDYTGSSKQASVTPNWNTTPDSDDTFIVYLPEGMQKPSVNVSHWNELATVELPLVPTTAGRKLDVSTGGEAGIDWANVGSPTTTVALTGTTIATTQQVDVNTIKTQAVTCSAGVTVSPYVGSTGAAINGTNANTLSGHDPGEILAGRTNITAGTITTATNVTTVNGLAANVITAASIAADAGTEIGAAVLSALGTGTWATAIPWNAAWNAEVQSEAQDAINASSLATAAQITALTVNTRANLNVPTEIETPDSSTLVYKIRLHLFDVEGNMEAPDSTPTIALTNASGTDRSSRLSTASNPSTGVYTWDYTATAGDTEEQLVWVFTVVEGGLTRTYPATSYVVEESAYRFSSTDRATLNAAATAAELAKVPKSDGSVTWNSTALASIQSEVSDEFTARGYSSTRAGYLDNLSGGAVALASTLATLAGKFTGITLLAEWLGLIAGKQTGNSTARTELRATGAGSGTYDETTDSQEALRERGDLAWVTATGFSTLDAAGVRTAVGLASANLDTQLGTLNTAVVTTIPAAIAGVAADLPIRPTKNVALSGFTFPMFDSTTHATPTTGLTVTAERSIDGGAYASCTNAVAEVSAGLYKIDLSASDMNGNTIGLKFSATGADTQFYTLITSPT